MEARQRRIQGDREASSRKLIRGAWLRAWTIKVRGVESGYEG